MVGGVQETDASSVRLTLHPPTSLDSASDIDLSPSTLPFESYSSSGTLTVPADTPEGDYEFVVYEDSDAEKGFYGVEGARVGVTVAAGDGGDGEGQGEEEGVPDESTADDAQAPEPSDDDQAPPQKRRLSIANEEVQKREPHPAQVVAPTSGATLTPGSSFHVRFTDGVRRLPLPSYLFTLAGADEMRGAGNDGRSDSGRSSWFRRVGHDARRLGAFQLRLRLFSDRAFLNFLRKLPSVVLHRSCPS